MTYRARRGTRVYAPDGSAFYQCVFCDRSIAVALFDIHKFDCLNARKRSRKPSIVNAGLRKRARRDDVVDPGPCSVILVSDGEDAEATDHYSRQDDVAVLEKPALTCGFVAGVEGVDADRLPRSAFRFFMESYAEDCGLDDWFEIDRTGFDKWRSMTAKERKPYNDKADAVELAYLKGLGSHEWREDSSADSENSSVSQFYKHGTLHYWLKAQ